jgi:outer membrane protein TolC
VIAELRVAARAAAWPCSSLAVVLLLAGAAAHAQAPEPSGELEIDLPTALRLADERNLDLAIYLTRIAEADARVKQARTLAAPTLRVGASASRHDGTLQETSGNVVDGDRSARFRGLGVGAVGAGDVAPPGVSLSVDLADAIFQPLVARQNRAAVGAGAAANRLTVLVDVASAYLEWLRARVENRVTVAALQRAIELATLTRSYADAGEGLPADAALAGVQPLLLEQRRAQAEERSENAAAELARLLHLDDGVQLAPREDELPNVELFDGGEDLGELARRAVEQRPETDQLDALVAAAEHDLTAQRYGWFIPSVALGYSNGSFGGGPGSLVANTGHRDDLSLQVYWQFDALGLGNRAKIDEKRAQLRRSQLERDKLADAIGAEVRRAFARLKSLREQRSFASDAVERARSAFDLHRERIYDQQGLPLEALAALQTLASAELAQLDLEAAYRLAQIRLYTAIGNPLELP